MWKSQRGKTLNSLSFFNKNINRMTKRENIGTFKELFSHKKLH